MSYDAAMTLSAAQIERFVAEGLVKVEDAFSRPAAAAWREIMWRDMKLSPDTPEDWKEPVVRLGMYAGPPFLEAASSPRLHQALDQLVSSRAWAPPQALGAMVVRFPVGKPCDDGWHIDASFPPHNDPASPDYFK